MSWEDKKEVKKGNIGERLVNQYLESRGWVIYKPITNKAHAFDKLCLKGKETLIIAEVKTKSRMNSYNATGFDTKHYEQYKKISEKYRMEVFVFFVDEGLGKIYGNKLSILSKHYEARDGIYPRKLNKGKIIIFSLEAMQPIANLKQESIEEIKGCSTRNYEYKFAQDNMKIINKKIMEGHEELF